MLRNPFALGLLALAAPALAASAPATALPPSATPAQEPASGQVEQLDQLVAIVNDQILTMREVVAESEEFARSRGVPVDTPGLIGAVARNTIADMLFVEGFRQAGLDQQVIQRVVDEEMERRVRAAGSMAAYERELASQGRSVPMERQRVHQEIIATYYQQAELGMAPELGGRAYKAFLNVTPAEIRAYWQEHEGEFAQPRQVNVRILQLRRDSVAEARGIIEAALAKLDQDPLAFAQAAEQHSAFGRSRQNLTGLIDPAEDPAVHPFRAFLADAEQGDVSEIVELPGGFVAVARVHEVEEAKTPTIGEAHRQIENILLDRKRRVALDRAIRELRDRCYVWMTPALAASNPLDDVYGLRADQAAEEEEVF